MNDLKYQYHLKTWGGFYNEQYKKVHGKEPGDYVFDTKEERKDYIKTLEEIEKALSARSLAIDTSEGYNCNVRTVIHRVIRYKDKDYYSSNDLGPNFSYDTAVYITENKWYPGFNDYPLGEDFDYDLVEIISEWVTGAFKTIENE